MIPYGRQEISKDDIESVVDVLRSDFLTQGPVVPNFEAALAGYCGAEFGIAVNSATSALHLACLALGLKKGDILWTSPISFVASSNCGVYCGASIDFVDIDLETYNMSVENLEFKLIQAEKIGKLPKIVIPVHLAGQSCDMIKIKELSVRYNFKIIEDASHAIGGKYEGSPIGSCLYSDVTVFSFHPVKIITTGEGGMCMTNSPEIASKIYRLRSHGIVRHADEMTCPPDGPWYYQQVELGYNYRMTDIQAALGYSQFKRLDEFVSKRHTIVSNYNELISENDFTLPKTNGVSYSSFHLYIIRVKNSSEHLSIFQKLRHHGILVNLHYIPIYRHPFYQKFNFDKKDFPNAEIYYSQAISLPIYTTLTRESQEYIAKVLNSPFGYQNLF